MEILIKHAAFQRKTKDSDSSRLLKELLVWGFAIAIEGFSPPEPWMMMALEDIFPVEAKVHLLHLLSRRELSICPFAEVHQQQPFARDPGQQIKVRAACFLFRLGLGPDPELAGFVYGFDGCGCRFRFGLKVLSLSQPPAFLYFNLHSARRTYCFFRFDLPPFFWAKDASTPAAGILGFLWPSCPLTLIVTPGAGTGTRTAPPRGTFVFL